MPTTIINNGKTITVPKTICNEMKEHFVKIGEKLGVQMININDKTRINYLGKEQVSSVYLRPTDNQEVIERIASVL